MLLQINQSVCLPSFSCFQSPNFMGKVLLLGAGLGLAPAVFAQSPIAGLLSENLGLDITQTNMARLIEIACPNGANETAFQARCNALVGAMSPNSDLPGAQDSVSYGLQQASPEQLPAQGVSATRNSLNIVGSRLAALRNGARGFQVAGLNNTVLPVNLASQAPILSGSAGDNTDDWSRLGGFVNSNFNIGAVDSEANQLGYNFNAGNINFGLDYRFTDELVLGAAFTYMRSESSFARNGGQLDSNAYFGALYGTYNTTENLYVDAIVSFGAMTYDASRHIQYALPGDIVNTDATASPEGNQYSIGLGSGYNYAMGSWLLNPYAKVDYIKLDVDSFREIGGQGWGMQFAEQSLESVTTTLGSQFSYTVNTAWGVLLPNIHGEWHHQYKDSSRNIAVRFLGDTTTGLAFNAVTTAPDRNYFTIGTGVSGTFAHGLSAFFNYDALVGYRNIDSHLFTLGARLEF